MDYERIQKPSPQGGGFSPRKLRSMLLGVEKRRKEEEEFESRFALQSETGRLDVDGGSSYDDFKDVDMVSSVPECSTLGKDQNLAVSRVRSQEEESLDAEGSLAVFEFQKGERGPQRPALVPPFSKPAPSKWDDARKWIASPTSTWHGKASGVQGKKSGMIGYGGRQTVMKVVMEVSEEVDTKRIDSSQIKKETGGQKTADPVRNSYPVADLCAKAALVENSVDDSAISLSQHDSSTAVQSATAFITPPSTVRSVSMRDMGTEMTPIASQEPSRTGTPARATTPMRSPSSSRPSTPQRGAPSSNSIEVADCQGPHNEKDLSEKELQMKTRREIMILGTQLGKTNITAWARKEEEENNVSTSLKTVRGDQAAKDAIQMRAAAWEDAEKAKYLARFKQEEIRIQAWENHQRAKSEAEIRKIEVEVDQMKTRAHDRLMNKLAAATHKAEEKRAVAEAKRNQQAARTAQQVQYIRRTGRIPSSFSCCSWCS